MANDKVFTLPIAASTQYVLNDATGSKGVTVSNDTGSGGNITILGTASVIIGAALVAPAAVTLVAGESLTLTSDTPLNMIIDAAAGASGKLILII